MLQAGAQAQSPFNYGKTKDVYFLSRKEIHNAGIVHIYTVEADEQRGNWAFYDIGFNQHPSSFYNRLCQSKWDSTRIPPLDSLIASSADFIVSSEYDVEGNKIRSRLVESFSLTDYTFYKGYAVTSNTERQIEGSTEAKINYLPDGRVGTIVCCKWLDADGSLSKEGRKLGVFRDTTFYMYDRQNRVTGYERTDGYAPKKRKAPFMPIFKNLKRMHESRYTQAYVGNIPFEQYIDHLIGYRPRLLLLEIYRNAVLPFQYDSRQRKYIECADIHLE